MQTKKNPFTKVEDAISFFSKYMSLLILAIMAVATWEVVARYVFDRPTTWAWLVNRQLFGLFILVAGPYTLVKRGHIRIEMLYDRFPARLKAVASGLSFTMLVCFMGALVWQGAIMGHEALMVKERAAGLFKLPLYPLKMLLPVFGAVFIIGGIAVFFGKQRP